MNDSTEEPHADRHSASTIALTKPPDLLVDQQLSSPPQLGSRLAAPDDDTRSPEHLLARLQFDSPYAGVYRAWREAALRDASIAAFDAEIEAWTSARIAAALRAVAVEQGTRGTVDLDWFAWMLSVLWWRLSDNLRLDRNALTETAAALVQSILFEDRAVPTELRPIPATETP